jgi:hypothetical protein
MIGSRKEKTVDREDKRQTRICQVIRARRWFNDDLVLPGLRSRDDSGVVSSDGGWLGTTPHHMTQTPR